MAQDAAYQRALQDIEQAKQDHAEFLDLSSILLAELPSEIAQLTDLRELWLQDNQLTALPEAIAQLTNLQTLRLNDNQLTTLPEAIIQLTSLQGLYLHSNQLTTLPEAIAQLSNLHTLYLDNNQLTTLPEAIAQLTNLQRLDLDNNQLIALPENIGRLKQLKILVLEENPLPIPAEIIRKGWGKEIWEAGEPKIVIDYYLESLAKGKQPLNEAKVILVGEGAVGKTSLVKRLCIDAFDATEGKTDGIVISNLELNLTPRAKEPHNVRLNIWDFGGQEIMHATHQFFLTKRSLYLLVLDNRVTEERNRLEYWLNTIESFGSDSPVIVVGNKSDEHPFDLNEKDLKQKYPNIKAFIPISCKKNQKLKTLRNLIRREIKALPHVGDVLPKPWFEVKEQLEQLQKNYIPYDEYEQICAEKGIAQTEKQKILVGLLHDLGIVLNFHDDPNVNDTHVINPEWLTTGIYQIINYPDLTTKYKGLLSFSLLAKILATNQYPAHKHKFIIAMMKKFELCLDLDTDTVLIPNLLPKAAPDNLDEIQWQDSLRFEYHYPILSQSIISRFIVKMRHHIDHETWWRTGVVLNNGQNAALIKADLYDKKIFIAVNGTPQTRRDFLAEIRGCFTSINQTFSEKSQPAEKIPIPGHPDVLPADYHDLLGLEKMGEKYYLLPQLQKRISIQELLNSIKSIDTNPQTVVHVARDFIVQSGDMGMGVNNGEVQDNAKVSGKFNEKPDEAS